MVWYIVSFSFFVCSITSSVTISGFDYYRRWPAHHLIQDNNVLRHNDLSIALDDRSIAGVVNTATAKSSYGALSDLERISQEQVDEMSAAGDFIEEDSEDLLDQEMPVAPALPAASITKQPEQIEASDNAQDIEITAAADFTHQEDSQDPDAANLSEKKQAVLTLMEQGEKYLLAHQPYEAFNKFTHDKHFRKGEIYLFVCDQQGTVLAHGEHAHLIWQNLIDARDSFGSPFIKMIIKKARKGGGWVNYYSRGASKVSYVKEVVKGNVSFILSAGFYPHSKSDAAVSLVKGAVAVFKQAMKNGKSKEEIFSSFSYPLGKFVLGDLYLYALDFEGVHMAHGDRPGLIGTNAINYQDATGKFVNKEIIVKLKEGGGGMWIDYVSKNAPKRAYAEKVVDREGKEYFISCGYYPDADQSKLVDLVRRGYEYMKGHAMSLAVMEFTDRKINTFRYGDLYLVVFDMKGKVIAHGSNPDFIGQNFYNDQDQEGHFYVREIIEKAKKLSAASAGEALGDWVNYKARNSFVSAYVKPIRIGLKEYIIVSGLFPVTKKETATLLSRSAAAYLRTESEQRALRAFVEENGKFMQGDLFVFVFAFNGICVAYGENESFIWQNMMNVRDDNNIPYVQVFINTAKQGRGKVTYTIDGVQRVVFVERVDKGDRSYVVGCGYFK